jgi:beta-galactosidase
VYMFHGGTNFGFTNGANDEGTYAPIVTSYDYDAPLDEAGNPTAKYWAMRDVIAKYADVPVDSALRRTAAPSPRSNSGAESVLVRSAFTSVVPLWQVVDRLGEWSTHQDPPTADSLGHYTGFTLYRTGIERSGDAILQVDEVRDRAQVFVDQQPVGVLARDHRDRAIALPEDARGVLDLLVEDLGRVDYGPRIGESKGLIGPATVNGEPITGWQVLPLNLEDLEPVAEALREAEGAPLIAGPAFARATFDAPQGTEIPDLFLDTLGWGKGVAWINGFPLGRYWSRGPQRTLYVPAPVLKAEGNELIILELHATASAEVRLLAEQELGHTEF